MYSSDDDTKCRDFKDDYLECGRHNKEVGGALAVLGRARPVLNSCSRILTLQNIRSAVIMKEWRRKCKAGELPCTYEGLQEYVLAKERIAALNGLPSP